MANARSPQGLAQTIISSLRSGIPHSYWDDFVAGLPIGASTKPEWEVEPGIPHPMFIEYLVEKLIKGNNSQTREQAMVTALNIASSPKQAIFFWKECKISLGNALDEAERHRKLGVKALPTPLWTKERPEPTLAIAAIAGTKIQQINNSTQAVIEAAKAPQIEGKSESPTPAPWKMVQRQRASSQWLTVRNKGDRADDGLSVQLVRGSEGTVLEQDDYIEPSKAPGRIRARYLAGRSVTPGQAAIALRRVLYLHSLSSQAAEST